MTLCNRSRVSQHPCTSYIFVSLVFVRCSIAICHARSKQCDSLDEIDLLWKPKNKDFFVFKSLSQLKGPCGEP